MLLDRPTVKPAFKPTFVSSKVRGSGDSSVVDVAVLVVASVVIM
jgi:hypothetical protein